MASCPSLSPSAGLSLKPDHYRAALETDVDNLWFEVHPENYMVAGGPRLAWLEAIREKHALSFHGVGASLGGLGPFDAQHLTALKALIERFKPAQVSEHATFSSHQGQYHADLLPLPRTQEAIQHLAARVSAFQEAIERRILIENPTNYLDFAGEYDEPEFLTEVAKLSGCGLLIDLNNIWVSTHNLAIDPYDYIKRIDPGLVDEIHIAGHAVDPILGESFLIDSHDSRVKSTVYHLLKYALNLWGPKPVLIERDGNIPAFDELLAEHQKTQAIIDSSIREHHDAA